MTRPRYNAASDDDACYCDELTHRGWMCGNCRKHAAHSHCEECHACLAAPVGLCAMCQEAEDAKFAPVRA